MPKLTLASFACIVFVVVLLIGAAPLRAQDCQRPETWSSSLVEGVALVTGDGEAKIYRLLSQDPNIKLGDAGYHAGAVLHCASCEIEGTVGFVDLVPFDRNGWKDVYLARTQVLQNPEVFPSPPERFFAGHSTMVLEPGELVAIAKTDDVRIDDMTGYSFWYDLPVETIKRHVFPQYPMRIRVLIVELHDDCAHVTIKIFYHPEKREQDLNIQKIITRNIRVLSDFVEETGLLRKKAATQGHRPKALVESLREIFKNSKPMLQD